MRTVTHLSLVVVSPSDVPEERDAVERVVDDINRDVARDRGLRLDVIRWEVDGFPGFHEKGPQGSLDPILGLDQADIVVGVFWKHFGTPTTDAESGTEHELQAAFRSWKARGRPQIMCYFNQQPYSLKSAKEAAQAAKVQGFKESYPREGLCYEYTGAHEFEEQLGDHLRNYLRAEFPLLDGSPAPPRAQSVVERFKGPTSIYAALCKYLEEYPYLFNTVFSSSDGVFPVDSERQRYYDLKLQRILEEKLKCRELYSGAADSVYDSQMRHLAERGRERVVRLPARFDVRRMAVPNGHSVVGFCVFLRSETELSDGVVLLGWLLDEGSVVEDQECVATDQPELVELYARHFLQLHNAAKKRPWPRG